jgi:hypothetical protein
MTKNRKSARLTDDEVRARDKVVDAIVKKGDAERMRVARAGASIFDRYFSVEQQAQIFRLQSACNFEGDTGVGKTIAELAQAALFVFGLDPISRDAFDRFSLVVFEDEDSNLINDIINEPAQAGEKWTKAQRKAELGTDEATS